VHLLQRSNGEVAVMSIAERDAARYDDDCAPAWARWLTPADARLVWAPSRGGNAPAGAWWPRSRDATAELSELVPMVERHLGGAVTRVSLNIDAWDVDHQPRRLEVNGRVLRLGWFHTLDSATVTVARGSGGRITLHVVPPEIDATAARGLLRELSDNSS
jgi:hypothetical protein